MKKIKLAAFIAALVTCLWLFFFLKSLSKPASVSTQEVIVAASDIAKNTQITKDMVKTVSVPTDLVLSEAITNESSVIGKVLNEDVAAGEQIVQNQLVIIGESDSNTLAYTVKEGMRAITIGVDETTGLDGMISPGNTVDIIAQYNIIKGETAVPTSILLLQNITVLAVDQVMSKYGSSESKSYNTITLEATPEQAVKLSFYEEAGLLRVVLRSPLDTNIANVPDVNQDNATAK